MSMAEPFLPKTPDSDNAPAAAEPGPGAPGAPLPEEPDILPGAAAEASEASAERPEAAATEHDNPPFRTPVAGERLTADELEDRI